MKKKYLCIITAITLIIALLPAIAFADDDIAYSDFDTVIEKTVDASTGAEGDYQYLSNKFLTESVFNGYIYFQNESAGPLLLSLQDTSEPSDEDVKNADEVKAGEYVLLPISTEQAGFFYVTALNNQAAAADYSYVITKGLKKVGKPSVTAKKGSLKVSWKGVADAEKYKVYYQTGKTVKSTVVKGKNSVTIKKLKKGKKYKVRVQALKSIKVKNATVTIRGDASAFSKTVKVK